MKIPNSRAAVIQPEKLRGYLLSTAHPIGRSKAVFFRMLGYTAEHWQRLESDLREQHLSRDATALASTRHGQKYEIRGTLVGPSGRSANVVSIWIVLESEDVPRFMTAFPGVSK